jgi:hypothetical protein
MGTDSRQKALTRMIANSRQGVFLSVSIRVHPWLKIFDKLFDSDVLQCKGNGTERRGAENAEARRGDDSLCSALLCGLCASALKLRWLTTRQGQLEVRSIQEAGRRGNLTFVRLGKCRGWGMMDGESNT